MCPVVSFYGNACRLQGPAEGRDIKVELEAPDAPLPSTGNVGGGIVDEEAFFRFQSEFFQTAVINGPVGLEEPLLGGDQGVVKIPVDRQTGPVYTLSAAGVG